MGDVIESAAAILSAAQRRVEIAGQNIASSTTPGYRRRVAFTELVSPAQGGVAAVVSTSVSQTPGKQIETASPFDLAITGDGAFAVRIGETVTYTRNGQFQRDGDGRLTLADGAVLQGERGDLIVRGQKIEISQGGVVSVDGEAVGRIPLFQADLTPGVTDTTAAAREIDGRLRQGALETSNVTTGEEMVSMMEALRRAEAAQRIINVYDDLLGRAVTTFGQA